MGGNEQRRRYAPIKGLRTDCRQVISLLPPRSPTCVLKTHTVGDGVLLPGHAPPRSPDILLSPFVGQVIDLAFRLGGV